MPTLMWTPRTTRVWIALVLAAVASLAVLVHPFYEAAETTNDASMYIACAKSLLSGEGYRYLGQPFTIRPPGFSLLIAPVLWLRGLDFTALNAFVGLFGVATVALLFIWMHPRFGTAVSLAIAIAVWLNPGFRQLCNQVMSDVPGAAGMFACLAVERWADRSPSARRDLWLGAAIAVASYVRAINVLLVPAIICARVVSRRGGVIPLVVATAVLMVPWSIRDALVRPDPPVDQNFLYSYSTAMWHTDGGDPSSPLRPLSDIVARVPERARQITSTLGSRMGTSDGSALEIAVGSAMIVALIIALVRRRGSAEFMALGVTAVLAVYFGFNPRLVLPVWLVAFPALVDAVVWLLGRAKWIVIVAIALLVCADWPPRRGWDKIEAVHSAYAQTCAEFEKHLAPDARVAAPIGWHESVYLDRPVYSLFFAAKRGGMEAVERVIDRYGINTVVLWPAIPADQAMLPYFRARYGGENVFRVRP